MPIKGISERRRFQRIAKVKIGKKEKNDQGVTHPVTIDYFLCEDAAFHEILGPEPDTIPIIFLTDDTESIFPQYLTRWGKSGLKCRGDGETAQESREDGEAVEIECKGEDCPYRTQEPPKCKPQGQFKFFIPKISLSGYYELTTSSYNSIVNINSALALAQMRFGRVSKIPFLLINHLETVDVENKSKKVPILKLMVDEEQVRQMKDLVFKLPGTTAQAELPAPKTTPEAPAAEQGTPEQEKKTNAGKPCDCKEPQPVLKENGEGFVCMVCEGDVPDVDSPPEGAPAAESEHTAPPEPAKELKTFHDYYTAINNEKDAKKMQELIFAFNDAQMRGELTPNEASDLRELATKKMKEITEGKLL